MFILSQRAFWRDFSCGGKQECQLSRCYNPDGNHPEVSNQDPLTVRKASSVEFPCIQYWILSVQAQGSITWLGTPYGYLITLRTKIYSCRFLNMISPFPGIHADPMYTFGGFVCPSSNLMSYVKTTWTSIAFSSFAAKNLPGLYSF